MAESQDFGWGFRPSSLKTPQKGRPHLPSGSNLFKTPNIWSIVIILVWFVLSELHLVVKPDFQTFIYFF